MSKKLRFDFWEVEDSHKHFQLTQKQLIERFQAFLDQKGKGWIKYHLHENVVSLFILNGLKSKHDPKQFPIICNVLFNTYLLNH
jgi:hypothetical protein